MRARLVIAGAAVAFLACRPAGDGGAPQQPSPPPAGPVPAAGGGAPGSPDMVAVPARTGPVTCSASCLYVDARSGSDAADGRSPATAWRTLQRAAAGVQPGSTVLVMSGTYTSETGAEPLLLRTSGAADAWITFAAAPGQHPVIQIPRGPGAWNGIHLLGTSYVVIDGFEIVGQNRSITAAEAAGNDGSQAVLNAACIYVDGVGSATALPHHVVLRNNDLHDCSGGGIVVSVADVVTIAYNHVHDDAWWTVFGESGIGAYHLTDAPGAAPAGPYRNWIVGNVVHGIRNELPWNGAGRDAPGIYDGNGIILDDGDHTQPAAGRWDVQGVPYTGRTYVANNVSYRNGGRGIHVFASAHVDVVNNTTFDDLLTPSPHITFGEIDAQASSDVNVLNDVGVNLNGKAVNLADGNLYDYSVWQGANVPVRGPHDLVADPLLADPGGGDFTPRAGSPALGTGTSRLAPSLDLLGNARPAAAIDRGAIQVSR